MKKLIMLSVLLLLFSCDGFMSGNRKSLSIVVKRPGQTRALTVSEINTITLNVSGVDMLPIEAVFTEPQVQVTVPIGPLRTFSLSIEMNDGVIYTGSKVVDVNEFTTTVTIDVEKVFTGNIELAEKHIGFEKRVKLRLTDITDSNLYNLNQNYTIVINKDSMLLQQIVNGTTTVENGLSCSYTAADTIADGPYFVNKVTLNVTDSQVPWKILFTFMKQTTADAVGIRGVYICTNPDETLVYHEGTFVTYDASPGNTRVQRTRELVYNRAAVKCTPDTVALGNTDYAIGDSIKYYFGDFITESEIIYMQKNSETAVSYSIFGPEIFEEQSESAYPKRIMLRLTKDSVISYLNLSFTNGGQGTYWLSSTQSETGYIHKGSFLCSLK